MAALYNVYSFDITIQPQRWIQSSSSRYVMYQITQFHTPGVGNFYIYVYLCSVHEIVQLVETLCYNPKGRGFESQ
jgi:hypothetical protein